MSAVVAKEPMGLCSCGSQIEKGEYVLLRNDGAIHVGCSERVTNSASKTTVTESSGYLFGEPEQAMIEHAKEVTGAKTISFDGASAMQIDVARLAGQLARVFELMRDGNFRTLSEIASATGCLETSASARLRDFRKLKFGRHRVIPRQVEGVPLLYEYKLILNEKRETDGRREAA